MKNSIHIYVTFSLVIYGNLDGVYVSKGMTTCICVYKDVLLLHIRLHAAFLQDIYIYSPYILYTSLSLHIPNLIFSSHSHSFPHHPPSSRSLLHDIHVLFGGKRKEKYFFIILASLCSLLLVYINIVVRICMWLRARTNSTQTSCYEGVFLFLITAIVCTLYTISTFTFFSFSSSALNRHFSLSHFALRVFEMWKKNQQIHLQGEEEKWWKTCDSLVC